MNEKKPFEHTEENLRRMARGKPPRVTYMRNGKKSNIELLVIPAQIEEESFDLEEASQLECVRYDPKRYFGAFGNGF